MNPINKNALRAAMLIHQHAAAANRQDASIHLPEYSWNNIQQLRRRIERARKHGWHAAADRLAEDLPRELDDCRRELERVFLACQSRQTQRPVSSASEIYRDIVGLFNEFEEVDIGFDEHELSVTTDSIELEGIPLGRFQIRLDWRLIGCRSQPYRVVALNPNPPAARDDVTHPHVQNEQLCEGEGRPAIRAALGECRVYDLFMLVSQLLHTYGRGSAYVELNSWTGVPCDSCGGTLDEDERYYCTRCDATLCSGCSSCCRSCGDSYCSDCLGRCAACGQEYCSACLAACRVCRKLFCDGCREDDLCLSCHQEQDDEESDDEPSENTRSEPAAATA